MISSMPQLLINSLRVIMIDMEFLEDRIRESRKERGISQTELANAVNVSRAAVSRWETGLVKNLKMEHLFAISRLLNINPEWLATGVGAKKLKNGFSQPQSTIDTLTDGEQFWLKLYRRLSPRCRINLQNTIYELGNKE